MALSLAAPTRRRELLLEISRSLDAAAREAARLAQSGVVPELHDRRSPLEIAEAIIAARRRRYSYFPHEILGEPDWDMLLDLYVARVTGRLIGVSSLTIASCAPATTALRHIANLERLGEIERVPDALDKRRTFLSLSEQSFHRMSAWLEQVDF